MTRAFIDSIRKNGLKTLPREIVKFILSKLNLVVLKKATFNELERTQEKLNEFYARNSSAIFHIGANEGEERFFYGTLNKPVFWFEASVETFSRLKGNLALEKNQHLFNICLSDANGSQDFYMASNQGQSSSLITPVLNHVHNKLISYRKTVIETKRFDSIFNVNEIPDRSHLVLDVQGSELKVLIGIGKLLQNFHSIYCEVTSGNSPYLNAPDFSTIRNFLDGFGFKIIIEPFNNFHGNVLFAKI